VFEVHFIKNSDVISLVINQSQQIHTMKHRQTQTQNKQIHKTNDKQAGGERFTVRPVRQPQTNDDEYTQ
jgi:hypothetical protein